MKTWFCLWIFCSTIIAVLDAHQSEVEGDDRPWWGRAIFALICGGVFAFIPGLIMLVLHAP